MLVPLLVVVLVERHSLHLAGPIEAHLVWWRLRLEPSIVALVLRLELDFRLVRLKPGNRSCQQCISLSAVVHRHQQIHIGLERCRLGYEILLGNYPHLRFYSQTNGE